MQAVRSVIVEQLFMTAEFQKLQLNSRVIQRREQVQPPLCLYSCSVTHTHNISKPTSCLGVWYKNYACSAVHTKHVLVQEGKNFGPCSSRGHPLSWLHQCYNLQNTRVQDYTQNSLFMPFAFRNVLELSLNCS